MKVFYFSEVPLLAENTHTRLSLFVVIVAVVVCRSWKAIAESKHVSERNL